MDPADGSGIIGRIVVPSKADKLYEVQDFITDRLSSTGASERTIRQLELVVEEIFINIASYAYDPPGSGEVEICCSVGEDMMKVVIVFVDKGPEFDPLGAPDPDISMDIKQRSIGGLGIHLVRNTVDGLTYSRDGDRNVLTIEKRLV